MLHGSIVALVTPFRNGCVDENAYQDLVEWHIGQGTHGFVPVGTTGESPTLSHAEHERVVELCIEAVAGRRPVVAGTGSNSTEEAISLTRHAAKAGADAALVVTPYYNKPTQEGLFAHFKAIQDAVDLPIVIYNIPGRSIVDMTPETMGRLAALPNIVGVKDSSADITRPLQTTATCGPEFNQLSGEDGNALAFRAHGGHGCISVTANVAPALCAQMHEAWEAGRPDEALAIHRRLMPLHGALFCETSPSPAKYALSRMGRCEADVRLPLVGLTDASKARVEAAMAAVGINA
ncbi:MAG TPA: 4-hydroxy-tetrahydrodipicolinate synthase [Geminicoccaceae bacterium]|nr:4-hydroxy-tetrahydrodipicolinate synthase [Geminicoccus sp.]HMU48800.1 4-hydroxy-tetrahydrodipicolinate synthase [Geminicoccaceae bacterium]